jgi:hypothetical protein
MAEGTCRLHARKYNDDRVGTRARRGNGEAKLKEWDLRVVETGAVVLMWRIGPGNYFWMLSSDAATLGPFCGVASVKARAIGKNAQDILAF